MSIDYLGKLRVNGGLPAADAPPREKLLFALIFVIAEKVGGEIGGGASLKQFKAGRRAVGVLFKDKTQLAIFRLNFDLNVLLAEQQTGESFGSLGRAREIEVDGRPCLTWPRLIVPSTIKQDA